MTRRTSPGASASRYRSARGLEHPHTLTGTRVPDLALLAILENFEGVSPDVLARYGVPAQVAS